MLRAGPDNIENIENIEKLQQKVRDGVSRLKGLDIGDELAVEIMAQLVEGRRTVSEMVERTYGLRVSDEGFSSSYNRVSREIRRLESKGLVSRKLLGRDKPYRLTQLAIANLARIGGGEQQLSLVTKTDIATYLVTVSLSVPHFLRIMEWIELAELQTIALLIVFCFCLGFSCSRLLQTLRRVF